MKQTEPGISAATWARLLSRERLSGARDVIDSPRTAFQRDYDRVVYSSAFRRLADKTQVYPLPLDDNVHTRLTHSLEVATVGRSLGTLVGQRVARELGALPGDLEARDFGDCVAAACLAHDLGNPPFGHVGEKAIREFFAGASPALSAEAGEHAWLDALHFEGNAQSFRLAVRTARPAAGHGLDLTCATLAALVKYPCVAAAAYERGSGHHARSKHGINHSEHEAFAAVAKVVGLSADSSVAGVWGRHPLAYLTEAADDIAYTVIDLEDGLRLGLVGFERFVELFRPIVEGQPGAPPLDQRPPDRDGELDITGQLRAVAVNRLVYEAADVFMARQSEILEGAFQKGLVDRIASSDLLIAIRKENFSRCYRARSVLKMELAGAAAIQGVLRALVDATLHPDTIRGTHLRDLLPAVLRLPTLEQRLQRILDHVSGMTDSYVVRLYRELSGMRLPGGRDF